MKNISKLIIVVLAILTGVVYVGIVGAAQTSSEISATQNAWFLIGYHFDDAGNPDEIRQVYASLPGDPSSSLQTLFNQWKLGIITRDKVRLSLVAYAKSLAGLEAVESFRLGEWCSLLLTAEKDFKSNIQQDHSDAAFHNMVEIEILARQAQGFIDVLSGELTKDVLDSLNKVVAAAIKIDVAGVFQESASYDEFTTAILSLPKYVATIIAVYMLESF